jgi:putative SOS response-associated peptidase YedK
MCGRYSLTTAPEAMRQLFDLSGPLANLPPRYNIAPTQEAPVVRAAAEGGGRELALLRWGLVPAWSQGPDSRYSMINARAETVAEKPSFRTALKERRCLVPADGFYEWARRPGGKQPYRIGLAGGAPFAFAGLWEHWRGGNGDGDEIQSFTIIVTQANDTLAAIHERMPVIVAPADYGLWLEGGPKATEEARALLRPYPGEAMGWGAG